MFVVGLVCFCSHGFSIAWRESASKGVVDRATVGSKLAKKSHITLLFSRRKGLYNEFHVVKKKYAYFICRKNVF